MNRIIYLLIIFINLTACKQIPDREISELNCENPVSDNKLNISLCLPNNNFEIENNENYIILSSKKNDSTNLSDVIFMVKVDDFKENHTSTWYRDEQLKEYQVNPEIDLNILSKGNQTIDGKNFADLEMIISVSDKKVYSRTFFYFDKTIGYSIDATVLTEKLNDESKSDMLSLLKTFKINGPPN